MVDITRGSFIWTLTGTPTDGTFVTGDPYVVDSGSGVELTARTPAPTGTGTDTRNGGMINPTNPSNCGFDGRCGVAKSFAAFSDSYNAEASYPITLNAGDTLLSAESYLPANASIGGGIEAMTEMQPLTVLGSNPGSGLAFRPPAIGTTKPLWLKSQVDYTKLPSLTPPIADPTTGSFPLFSSTTYDGSYIWYTFGPMNVGNKYPTSFGIDTIRPKNNLTNYPAESTPILGQLGLCSLCDWGDGGTLQQTYANRLIQIGIDYYAMFLINPTNLSGGAGYGNGYLFPILYAGFMLDDEAMMSVALADSGLPDGPDGPIPVFWENYAIYSSPDAWRDYRYPRPRSSYQDGPPLFGQARYSDWAAYGDGHLDRDSYGQFHSSGTGLAENGNLTWPYPRTDGANTNMYNVGGVNANTYMQCCSVSTIASAVLTARILGFADRYYSQAVLDMADTWVNDPGLWPYFRTGGYTIDYTGVGTYHGDIYGHGGSGNGFCKQMWDTYRYPGGRKLFAF